MMADSTYQRSNLTVNNGTFYIDTTVSAGQSVRVQPTPMFLSAARPTMCSSCSPSRIPT